MRSVLALLVVALSLWAGRGEALAEDAAPVPDLTGTWTCSFKVMKASMIGEGLLTLRVVAQDGPLLKVEKSWASPDQKYGETNVLLVGVVGFDGRSVSLAEQDLNGLFTGSLTSPDTLELVFIEAGNATAYRVKLTRQK